MSDRKKLLIIVPTLHQGGQEHVVVRSAYLLSDTYDVTIAIFDDSDIGYDVSGLNIVNLNVPAARSRIFKIVNILRRMRKLAQLKARIAPDISYSYGPSADIINALTAADSESTWIGLRNYTDAADTRRMKIYIRHSDLIVCCARDIETYVAGKFGIPCLEDIPVSSATPAAHDHAGESGSPSGHDTADTYDGSAAPAHGIHTCVLHNLYDLEDIHMRADEEEPEEELPDHDFKGRRIRYLISMGRDDDQKMFWHMLKSFKLIHTQMPQTRLIILGDGTFDSFKRMARFLGLDDCIIFAGRQDNPYKYLKHADINWMTSRNEGFPNALVEGMALGLVTVSTNCMTGPAEILTADGDVYSCTDELNEMLGEYAQSIDATVIPEFFPPAAIYGEYGILTPAMTPDRNMDFAHITFEHYNLAHVIIGLLHDDNMMARYESAALKRAQDYGYETYRQTFDHIAEATARRRS